ncbi:MAG: DNA-processing protein DprA [Eubacteriales bacterium]
MNKRLYWYWLCNIKGIGLKKTKDLLNVFKSPEGVWLAKEKDYKHILSLRPIDIKNIVCSKNRDEIKKSYQELVTRNIRFITHDDSCYPTILKEIYDPPFGLYVKGSLPNADFPTIAIIGARRCSTYGKEMAMYFARELAKKGFQIISGLARGIDTAAHIGALKANKKTFGILGNGLNICYPKENYKLYMEMEQNGGIISEYNININPSPGNFPLRNRIISGMCQGIFVVEAAKKSGSLITAELGLENGKDIFALPGRNTDPLSEGTNDLIKMGAKMVTKVDDIIEEFNYNSIPNSNGGDLCSKQKGTIKIQNDNVLELLNNTERIVYACLSLEPKHIDDIACELNMKIQDIMHILFVLEMKSIIKQLPNKHFIINL